MRQPLEGAQPAGGARANALLSEPSVLFLDEPTSGLDPVAAREVHDLVGGLREKGVTIFLTTHRLEEAESLCDRVAILNTTLRTIGRPEELREQLFKKALVVETVAPLDSPAVLFAGIESVDSWRQDGPARYLFTVAEPRIAAPEVTRALVAAGADVLSRNPVTLSKTSTSNWDDVEVESQMTIGSSRIAAVMRKELQDFRRKRSIVADDGGHAARSSLPPPSRSSSSCRVSASATLDRLRAPLLYILLIPVIMPGSLAGYAVVGEREQGTLEPLLTTPIRREELLIGKAAAAMIPAVVTLLRGVRGLPRVVRLFANPAVSSAVFHESSVLVAQVLFTPLLAGWAIWPGWRCLRGRATSESPSNWECSQAFRLSS